MGTRCVIAKEEPDGTFRAILCFMDGGPEQAGRKLLRHYREPAQIDRLLDIGDISSLGNSPSEPVEYRRMMGRDVEEIIQTVEERCIFYGRGHWPERGWTPGATGNCGRS